jgi:branched-chain amino acid transport system permease protein
MIARRIVEDFRAEAVAAFLLILLALMPLLGPSDFVYQLVFISLINIGLAVSWVIIGGYTGYYSFGPAAFYGLGAYCVALFLVRAHGNFVVGLALGAIVAGILAILVGAVSLRIRGPYFSLLTLFIVSALQTIVSALPDFTGGEAGFSLPFLTNDFEFLTRLYLWMAIAVVAITVGSAVLIERSRLMLALNAIRDDEEVAEAMGVRTSVVKVAAFTISSALAGLIGGVATLHAAYVGPGQVFSIFIAINAILAPVAGGMRNWIGPVVGALLLVAIDYGTRFFASASFMPDWVVVVSGPLNRMLYGVLLVAVVMFFRNGIVGTVENLARRRRRAALA